MQSMCLHEHACSLPTKAREYVGNFTPTGTYAYVIEVFVIQDMSANIVQQ